MKRLAYIGKIVEIKTIKGADFIVSATVVCGSGGKWMGTVKKGEFEVGQLVDVFLQDAILPETEEYEFLRPLHFRIAMRKFKKVPSECLIMPLAKNCHMGNFINSHVGDDISEFRGVKKYIKQLPANLAGIALGSFPTNIIPKTDEINFQAAQHMIDKLQGQKYYCTVKADGSSGTIYKTNNHFGCCSRNLEFKPSETTAVWKIANDYELEKSMPAGFAIQFEMVGPGIQKNRLGLDKIDARVFNVWNIEKRCYLDAADAFDFIEKLNMVAVDILVWNKTFNITDDQTLRKMAEGKYDSGYQREGIVIRPMIENFSEGERLSFKVINLLYKD